MTDNEASVIDEGTFSVRRTIRIAAPVEKVWTAVTEPEHISRWFGRTVLDGTGVGATGTITFPDYGSVPIRVEQSDAPRTVTYRWGNDDALGHLRDELDDRSTVFTFTLEPVRGVAQLRADHPETHLAADPNGFDDAHLLQHGEVLRDRLPRDGQTPGEGRR